MKIETFEDADPTGALVIVAFPSPGAAGPIAGRYLIDNLVLPLVGHMVGPMLEGLVHVENGTITSPVRVHGGEVDCKLNEPCQKVFIVTTETPIPAPALADAAKAVREWARNAALLLCVDAVVREEGDDTPDVFVAATNEKAAKNVAVTGAELLVRARLGGLTGFLLSQAVAAQESAAAIVVEAANEHPDGRAAAALIEKMDALIPQIAIDAKPLLEDALLLEQAIRRAIAEAEMTDKPTRPSPTFI